MKKEPLIILTGPTAVGKTELSIALAKAVNGEIISADSMQVYRYMDIGTAKIMPEEMEGIKHYLVDELDPKEEFHVARFQQMAKDALKEIYAKGKIPLIVGGTGFYIQSLLYDIDFTKEEPSAVLNYNVEIKGKNYNNITCKVELFDEEGTKLSETEGSEGTFEISNVRLWQPLNAYLYKIKVTAGQDVYTLPYGVRSVRVDGTKFLINEKPFYFKGYGKHEDTFPNGRGINLPMNTKDISIMKWQHANSFRTSHYPYSEEMMRLCDEEGIVVIDETTAVGVNLQFGGGANFGGERIGTFDKEHGVQTQEHHKDVIRDLISRDKNHACVVMWSIANEPDSAAEGAYEYFKPLYDLARELDPQKRPCTLVSVQGTTADTDCSAQLSDVICLNRYYGWYFGGPDLEVSETGLRKELSDWGKLGKPVMFTEYGADTVSGLHDTTSVMYTEEYQVEYYEMNNKVFDEFDFVVGEQAWNFADFATSQSLLRVQGNKKGLFTRDRKPKMVAHYFRNRWSAIPEFGYKTK